MSPTSLTSGRLKLGAADMAYRAVLYELLRGSLPPGEAVTERVMGDRLGLSRTPLRQALRNLEHDGLLTRSDSGTLVVSELTFDRVVDLYRCRARLECLAVDQAIARAPDELLSGLFADLERLDTGFGAPPRVSACFHDALFRLSLNNWLTAAIRPLSIQLELVYLTFPELIPTTSEADAAHRAIVRALQDRDASTARQAVVDHAMSRVSAAASAWTDNGSIDTTA